MNNARYLIATVVVAVFLVFWGWFFHDVVIHAFYNAVHYSWGRSYAEIQSMYVWIVLAMLIFSFFFVFFFTRYSKHGGAKQGLTYGFWIGLMFSATMLAWYAFVPLTLGLVFWWMAGGLVELTIAGWLAGLIYTHK